MINIFGDAMTKIDRFLLILFPLPFTTLGLRFFSISGNYFPELFVILWLFLALATSQKRRDIVKKLFLARKTMIILFFVFGISLFSLIQPDFDLIPFYGRLRALIVLILGFIFVIVCSKRGHGEVLIDCLIIICAASCFYYIVDLILSAKEGLSKINVSMASFSILVCLFLEKKRFLLAIIFSILSGVAAFLSFWRQNYLLAIILIFFTLLYCLFKSIYIKENRLKISFHMFPVSGIFLIVSSVIFFFWNFFVDFLSSSESRYKQSIGKIEDLINGGDDGSASVRADGFRFLFNNLDGFLLPNGLINDAVFNVYSIWNNNSTYLGISIVRDSGFAYFLITFGALLLIVMIVALFLKFINFMKYNFRLAILRFFIIFPSVIIIILFDGLSITQVQKSLFFGIGVALLITPCRYVRNK